MDDLSLRQRPAPMQRLRRSTLLVGALLVVVVIGALAYAKAQIPPLAQLLTREQAPVATPVPLPDALKAVERPYAELVPKPQPPVAQPVPKPPPPPPVAMPVVLPQPVLAQADPMPGFLELMQKQQALTEKVAAQPLTPATPPPAAQKPARQAWRVKPTDISLGRKEGEKGGEGGKGEQEKVAREGEAKKLIQNAVWAKAAQPWRTLYRSQLLPSRTLDAIVSEIPGTVRLELTVPIYDRFGMGYVIFPKGTILIASQDGASPTYGMSRIPLKLEQAELESGEVISFKATIGDSTGASGLKGNVDNHVGKLVLATGLSALLNIGVRAAAGTPGTGNYFQNPAQSAAGDIGQSVQRDASSIIDRELRIRPTITIPVGTFATVQVGENITFSRPARIVR